MKAPAELESPRTSDTPAAQALQAAQEPPHSMPQHALGPRDKLKWAETSVTGTLTAHFELPASHDAGELQPARCAKQHSETQAQDQEEAMKTVAPESRRAPSNSEISVVCAMLREAIALREKYRTPIERQDASRDMEEVEPSEDPPYEPFVAPPWNGLPYSFEMRRGVMVAWAEASPTKGGPRQPGRNEDHDPAFAAPPSMSHYFRDISRLLAITSDAAVNSFCFRRLQKLEARCKPHLINPPRTGATSGGYRRPSTAPLADTRHPPPAFATRAGALQAAHDGARGGGGGGAAQRAAPRLLQHAQG